MKAAKKRYHKKIPEFWNILKNEKKPLLDSERMSPWWRHGGMYPGELSVICMGRSLGKSQSQLVALKILKNRKYGKINDDMQDNNK